MSTMKRMILVAGMMIAVVLMLTGSAGADTCEDKYGPRCEPSAPQIVDEDSGAGSNLGEMADTDYADHAPAPSSSAEPESNPKSGNGSSQGSHSSDVSGESDSRVTASQVDAVDEEYSESSDADAQYDKRSVKEPIEARSDKSEGAPVALITVAAAIAVGLVLAAAGFAIGRRGTRDANRI